jgi:hypothetical protein
MKKILLALILLPFTSFAQDETIKGLQKEASKQVSKSPPDTAARLWRLGGIYNFNLSQGSLNNWAAGGDDFSLSINSLLSLYGFYKKGRHNWDNTFDLNFGYVRTTSLGSRKNDDRIDLLSKYGYGLNQKWFLSGLMNFRSQVAPGFTYSEGRRTFSSAFLSPAYLLASIGFDYKPNPAFSVFISPATARWIIVRDDSLSAKGLYGVRPGRHSEMETGAFLTANYLKEIRKNITYKARLDLFSNYERKAQNVDLFMSNILSAKISNAISMSWNIDFIYDDDVRIFGKTADKPGLQLKSLVGVGLALKF